jgi:hypothetical protein
MPKETKVKELLIEFDYRSMVQIRVWLDCPEDINKHSYPEIIKQSVQKFYEAVEARILFNDEADPITISEALFEFTSVNAVQVSMQGGYKHGIVLYKNWP